MAHSNIQVLYDVHSHAVSECQVPCVSFPSCHQGRTQHQTFHMAAISWLWSAGLLLVMHHVPQACFNKGTTACNALLGGVTAPNCSWLLIHSLHGQCFTCRIVKDGSKGVHFPASMLSTTLDNPLAVLSWQRTIKHVLALRLVHQGTVVYTSCSRAALPSCCPTDGRPICAACSPCPSCSTQTCCCPTGHPR